MIDIPTTATEFSKWRKKQKFAPELDRLAGMVLSDLDLLERIDMAPPGGTAGFVQLRADIAKTRAEFEAALSATKPRLTLHRRQECVLRSGRRFGGRRGTAPHLM